MAAQDYRKIVADQYKELLGRDPDEGGASYWGEAVQKGLTTDQLRAGIASSAEAMARLKNGTAPPATYVEKEQSPAKLMTGLLAKDSPYLEQARTGALQGMQGRGLLSSSMAIGAAEAARIAAASPLAQQEASQNTNRNLSAQDFRQSGALSAQNFDQSGALSAQDFRQSEKLQTQRIVQDTAERQLDRNLQTQLASWNLDSATQTTVSGVLMNYQQLFEQTRANIMADTNLTAEARTNEMRAAEQRLQRSVQSARDLFSVELKF